MANLLCQPSIRNNLICKPNKSQKIPPLVSVQARFLIFRSFGIGFSSKNCHCPVKPGDDISKNTQGSNSSLNNLPDSSQPSLACRM
ncbi:MAG: hypothetical protein WBN88_14445 [Anderseniella sp.]